MKRYFVYIATNHNETLYIGVTNDLVRRMYEHALFSPNSFTAKYNINTLIYFEETTNILDAIAREKQLKGWRRSKKIALIEQLNPHWQNLLDRPFDFAQGDNESKQDDIVIVAGPGGTGFDQGDNGGYFANVIPSKVEGPAIPRQALRRAQGDIAEVQDGIVA